MASKLLAGVGLAVLLAVLVGAAADAAPSRPVISSASGNASTLTDLPLNQAFRVYLGSVGNYNGWPLQPFTAMMPANAGIAITQIDADGGNEDATVGIRIDGLPVWNGRVSRGGGQAAASIAHFDPPIIVKPGETLEIASNSPNQTDTIYLSIGGYGVTAAQLGL